MIANLSPFIQELTMFPLVDGAAYVTAVKSGGPENLREAFHNPPRPESETKSAVVWDVVLESKEAADQFQSAALQHVSAVARKEDMASPEVAVETLNKRFLMVSRVAADRVRFVNASDTGTTNRLKASATP